MTDQSKPDRQDGEALRNTFKPFNDFMSRPSFYKLPDSMQITSGSSMAGRQLTVGDLRKLATAILAASQPRDAAEGAAFPPGWFERQLETAAVRAADMPDWLTRETAPPKPAPDAMREALSFALAEIAEDRPSAGTIKTFEKWADRLLAKFDVRQFGEREALHDLHSHKSVWRGALLKLGTMAKSDDDRTYWSHEIRAFDRTFAALSRQAPHSGDGEGR